MRHPAWIVVAASLLALASDARVEAFYCGAASARCCPSDACAPNGNYCAAQRCCGTRYRTVRETVYEQQTINCCRTVYEQCCEQIPVTCTRNVYDTCYRDECYTVCKPCYQTCYRDVCCTVRKPCFQTC